MADIKLTTDVSAKGVGPGAVLLMAWAVAAAMVVASVDKTGRPGFLLVLLHDLPISLAIFIAAGGWGRLAVGKLMPAEASPVVRIVTAMVVGLYLLSTAVLVAGSVTGGALTRAVWWPVIGVGIVLAFLFGRKRLIEYKAPKILPPAALLAILVAAAVGLWLAGAAMPAGKIGVVNGDFYDVVSYHLQLPREFLDNGRVSTLEHNTYSHYPLGAEMLFTVAMILKGGAWPGVFAAKFTHGLWGLLAVAGVYASVDPAGRWRRRSAAVLLATTPAVLYLSWLAYVELAQLACLAVAIAHLRLWMKTPAWRPAVMIGLACGVACATKYLAVGLVAAPVLAVMAATCLRRPKLLTHGLTAGVICVAVMSPWLVRTAVATGNPVFPLATSVFGGGHWTVAQADRWDAGHTRLAWSERPAAMLAPWISDRGFGLALTALVAAGFVTAIGRGRRMEPIDRICVGILGIQILVWTCATHMAWRFLIPAAVPACLLAGGAIERLARWASTSQPPKRWTQPAATILTVVVAIAGVLIGWDLYRIEQRTVREGEGHPGLHGMYPFELADMEAIRPVLDPLQEGGRLLLVGDIRPFNFPAGTRYASIWEKDPLTHLAGETTDGAEIVRRLRDEFHLTHVLVNWGEIVRLHKTYGYWEQINPALFDAMLAGGARDLNIPARRAPDGRPMVQMLELPAGQ